MELCMQTNENKRLQRDHSLNFIYNYRKKTTQEFVGEKGTKNCRRIKKKLNNWSKTKILYSDWDQGCICGPYNMTITKAVPRYMEDYGY